MTWTYLDLVFPKVRTKKRKYHQSGHLHSYCSLLQFPTWKDFLDFFFQGFWFWLVSARFDRFRKNKIHSNSLIPDKKDSSTSWNKLTRLRRGCMKLETIKFSWKESNIVGKFSLQCFQLHFPTTSHLKTRIKPRKAWT